MSIEEEILKEKVVKSANFMAPYFSMDKNSHYFYHASDLLKIRNGGKECAYRQDNVMFLLKEANDSDIGHELGHWFHNVINPEGFNFGVKYAPHILSVYQYLEIIADYGEAVNITSGAVVKDENLKSHMKFLINLPRLKVYQNGRNELGNFLETEKEKLNLVYELLGKYVERSKRN